MSYDSSRTRPPTAFEPPPDDLLTELVGILAAVLHLKSEKIDPEQTFRSLGLDSLLTVEFVATVNARYGTAVKPDALFDQPTPLAFARHVTRERGALGHARAGTPAHPGARLAQPPAPAHRPAPGPTTPAAPEPGRQRTSAPEPAPTDASAREAVLEVLREELARILCCDPWEVSTTAAFNILGIDSILGAQFVATINEIYGTRERAVSLYDHPNLAAMAAHITSVTDPGPAPGGVPDLADLLDAVRDDRISVDDALALLPRRA
ncbi:phosphopantetheine-binding protein [Streptomyces sp. NPDC017454]|uniref:phosphopantetheine-binding protein n=1 Tax=Streptomyces sp. NPDC017454 TaxID=3364997 RepID=UPI0037A4282F